MCNQTPNTPRSTQALRPYNESALHPSIVQPQNQGKTTMNIANKNPINLSLASGKFTGLFVDFNEAGNAIIQFRLYTHGGDFIAGWQEISLESGEWVAENVRSYYMDNGQRMTKLLEECDDRKVLFQALRATLFGQYLQ